MRKDKFRSARGGRSRLLRISCSGCETEILLYQKDGPGTLKRMYFDRIHAPERLVGLQHKDQKQLAMLTCGACGRMIGVPTYTKKKRGMRSAVFQDAITKHVMSAKERADHA
jgi:hypothetical protein